MKKSLDSKLDFILNQIDLIKDTNDFDEQCHYLSIIKRHSKNIFDDLKNHYDTQAQAISIVTDCLVFNDNSKNIIDNAMDILESIIRELKNKTITQSKLEKYVENLYKNGLRLFGASEAGEELLKKLLDSLH